PPAFEAHHVLNDGLALLGDLGGFPGPAGAIFAQLPGFPVDLDRLERVYFFTALFAHGHWNSPSIRIPISRARVSVAAPRVRLDGELLEHRPRSLVASAPTRGRRAMGIFDRMGKVIQSNLNALLDKAEDDKKLIELNLDEMDEQVKGGQREVVSALAAEKQLAKKGDQLRAAEPARKAGEEPLAREALKQKKRTSAELASAESARSEQHPAALKMKDDLERMKQKLSELKMKRGTLATRAANAKSGGGSEQLGARGGSSAFDNFRRMEEKIEGREAQGSAMAEVEEAIGKGPKTEDLEAKFRELERGGGGPTDIDDELAALKKRIRI